MLCCINNEQNTLSSKLHLVQLFVVLTTRFTQNRSFTLLQDLSIAGNPISTFPANLLPTLRGIRSLDIRYMHLTKLPNDFIVPGHKVNLISLEGNPWKCDCGINSLARWSRFEVVLLLIDFTLKCNKSFYDTFFYCN